MSSRNIPGEFFDCTIQSYNDNGHGTHKIDYSLQYGISIPMIKYIEELRMIFENTNDDKSDKRAQRLEFLEFLSQEPVFLNYFQYFTTYINGGGNFPDLGEFGSNFETNKLILITAGGNIFTIFAKLIEDLMNNGKNVKTKFNKFMIGRWSLTKLMIDLMKRAPKRLKDLVTNIASYPYSDFDFNLLPNKQYITREEINYNNRVYLPGNRRITQSRTLFNSNEYRNQNNSEDESNHMSNEDSPFLFPDAPSRRSQAGFYLFRAKTNFEIHTPDIPDYFKISHGRNYCKKAGISQKKLELFYPQGAQRDWLSNRALHTHNNPRGDKRKCYNTITHLLKIKHYIEQETRNNVTTCINTIMDNEGLDFDIDGAMEYIRTINLSMNTLLKDMAADIAGEQHGEETEEERKIFLNNFSSLDSILKSDLPFVSVEIINHLINSEELGNFTEQIMETKQLEYGLPKPEGCSYNIIPTGLHRHLRKLKAPMDALVYNEERPPIDGFRISFNNIVIEPRDYEGEPVPKLYAEEGDFDELAKSFEQLAVQMKNHHVKDATNVARNRLLRNGPGKLNTRKKRHTYKGSTRKKRKNKK